MELETLFSTIFGRIFVCFLLSPIHNLPLGFGACSLLSICFILTNWKEKERKRIRRFHWMQVAYDDWHQHSKENHLNLMWTNYIGENTIPCAPFGWKWHQFSPAFHSAKLLLQRIWQFSSRTSTFAWVRLVLFFTDLAFKFNHFIGWTFYCIVWERFMAVKNDEPQQMVYILQHFTYESISVNGWG